MKLNGIAAAAHAVVAKASREAELEAAAKIAAEKLPLKDAMRDLAQKLDVDLNQQLQVAIERFLGAPITDPEKQVRGRLGHTDYAGDEQLPAGMVYLMGETPILWVAPAAITREGDMLRAERPIRQLLPELRPEDQP